MVLFTATLASVGGIPWFANSRLTAVALASLLGVLVVGVFSAVVALQPHTIGVVITPFCRAAEEAVGVATFLMKLVIRCVPIFFATAVIIGTCKAASLLLYVMRYSDYDEVFLLGVSQTAGLLFLGAALPVFVYILTLIYYLTLDVISAIVSIPAKLDRIAEVSGRGGS